MALCLRGRREAGTASLQAGGDTAWTLRSGEQVDIPKELGGGDPGSGKQAGKT
jgi:hypothetical protein